jgi:hypothetical protein
VAWLGLDKNFARPPAINLFVESQFLSCFAYLCGHRSSKHRQELLLLSYHTTRFCPSSCCALGASCLSALTAARGYQAVVQLKVSPSAAAAGEGVAVGLWVGVGLLLLSAARVVGDSSTATGCPGNRNN